MTPQQYAAIAMAIITPCIIAGAVYVVCAKPRPPEEESARFAKLRRRAFFILAPVMLSVIVGASFWTPYRVHDAHMGVTADADDVFVVNVVGHQWYWELTDRDGNPIVTIPAGKVRFRVKSADATHNFTIEDPSRKLSEGRLIAQTQAMPGYEHVLEVFLKPGEYDILCSTYCAGPHAHMKRVITVVSRDKGEVK